ncbi:MAG: hypothetical protein B7X10_00845 [Burkholderiales bacterium 21-58-4]|nr:MAG: hypothetical protein B7X10_00845 [Burkholderiales bacterium 21-58-4]
MIDGDTGIGREFGERCDADTRDHEIGRDLFTAGEDDRGFGDRCNVRFEAEGDAVIFVQCLEKCAEVRAQHRCHWLGFLADDQDFDLALAQRGSDFHADETRSDDDGARAFDRQRIEIAAVGHGAEVVDEIAAGEIEARGHGTGRDQQGIVGVADAVGQHDLFIRRVDQVDAGI